MHVNERADLLCVCTLKSNDRHWYLQPTHKAHRIVTLLHRMSVSQFWLFLFVVGRFLRLTTMSANPSNLHEALLHAARTGDCDQVVALIAQQADIDYDDDGWTALHYAAMEGHTSTCQALIDHQANIDACDQSNQTPLHLATINGHASICQALIDHQANINACATDNQTALHRAAINGHTSICQALIDNGADCTIRMVRVCERLQVLRAIDWHGFVRFTRLRTDQPTSWICNPVQRTDSSGVRVGRKQSRNSTSDTSRYAHHGLDRHEGARHRY